MPISNVKPAAGKTPAVAVALNALAAVWIVLGVGVGLSVWPTESTSYTPTPASAKAPAVTVMFLGGLAATVSLSAAAIVTQLAKRGDDEAA